MTTPCCMDPLHAPARVSPSSVGHIQTLQCTQTETLFGSLTFGNGAAARELSRKASGSDPSEWWKVCRKVTGKDAGSKVDMDPWPLTPWLIKPFSASDADDSLYPLPLQVPTASSLDRWLVGELTGC